MDIGIILDDEDDDGIDPLVQHTNNRDKQDWRP